MIKLLKYIIILSTILSCSNDDRSLEDITLNTYLSNRITESGAVIACAASEVGTNNILIFYYPEEGATNVRLYATEDANVDNNDFSKYTKLSSNALPVFNGYLEKRIVDSDLEKWIIVTFELDDEIKMSNPIRTKQESKPTVWDDDVVIDLSIPELPNFSWVDNPYGDNAIYFQVITDSEDNLLSGTYTYENNFQYYNTSNVVLNITTVTPPTLMSDASYNFTLMDVSQDNWVSHVVEKTFNIQ